MASALPAARTQCAGVFGPAVTCGFRAGGRRVLRERSRLETSQLRNVQSRSKQAIHCSAHGQFVGRWSWRCRARRVMRPGRLKNRRRIVFATSGPRISSPSTPSHLMRLWAIVAHTAQAPLAPKRPDGQWESPDPSFRSLMASSMTA